MSFEKRRNPRFSCLETQTYPVDFRDDYSTGHLFDLSRGGISLKSAKPLNKDDVCALEIWASDLEKPISCEACIVWVRFDSDKEDYIYGARILRMDPSSKTDLLDTLYQSWKEKVLD